MTAKPTVAADDSKKCVSFGFKKVAKLTSFKKKKAKNHNRRIYGNHNVKPKTESEEHCFHQEERRTVDVLEVLKFLY